MLCAKDEAYLLDLEFRATSGKHLAQCLGTLLLFSRLVMSDFFAVQWTVSCQASLSVGFPRQEDWRGLPFPLPRVSRESS